MYLNLRISTREWPWPNIGKLAVIINVCVLQTSLTLIFQGLLTVGVFKSNFGALSAIFNVLLIVKVNVKYLYFP